MSKIMVALLLSIFAGTLHHNLTAAAHFVVAAAFAPEEFGCGAAIAQPIVVQTAATAAMIAAQKAMSCPTNSATPRQEDAPQTTTDRALIESHLQAAEMAQANYKRHTPATILAITEISKHMTTLKTGCTVLQGAVNTARLVQQKLQTTEDYPERELLQLQLQDYGLAAARLKAQIEQLMRQLPAQLQSCIRELEPILPRLTSPHFEALLPVPLSSPTLPPSSRHTSPPSSPMQR